MKTLRLAFRWKVLKEVLALLQTVGDAYEDGQLSNEERSDVMKAFWAVVKTYRGK